MLQSLIWPSCIFKEKLPEPICCCLQTCNVDVVLLVMYCMYIQGYIVTSADISQLWVYIFMLFSLTLVVVVYKLVMFMEVYGAWVTLYYISVQNFRGHLC